MNAKSSGQGKKKGSAGYIGVLITIFICMLVIGPTTMLMLVGLIPTIIAFATDRDPEKYAGICVGMLNVAGVLPYVIELWLNGHTTDVAARLLASPVTWLVMYMAAAVGWGVYYGVPSLVSNYIALHAEMRLKKLEKAQEELLKKWGNDLAGNGLPDDY